MVEELKSPTKTFGATSTTAMYKDPDRGTSYSLAYLTSVVAARLNKLFGAFTISEDDAGRLIIDTGLVRDRNMDRLIAGAAGCNQPCTGECEGQSCESGS